MTEITQQHIENFSKTIVNLSIEKIGVLDNLNEFKKMSNCNTLTDNQILKIANAYNFAICNYYDADENIIIEMAFKKLKEGE